jgi:hypothetical protein
MVHKGQVMGTPSQPGAITVTPIYWAPNQSAFGTGYETASTKFLTSLAASSGSLAAPYSVLPQYTDGSGTHLVDSVTTAAPIADTEAYPDTCSASAGPVYNDNTGYSSCIDDQDIMTEVTRLADADNLSEDWAHIDVVYLPKGVEDCQLETTQIGSQGPQSCTANDSNNNGGYCAYHSFVNPSPTATPTIYAVIPYPIWNSATGLSCAGVYDDATGQPDSPNGLTAVDIAASSVSHEIAEAITDPEGAGWMDSSGSEIGDLCAYTYGPLSGVVGARSDVTLNGTPYLIQEEFSNAAYKLSKTQGCQVAWTAPTVALASSGSLIHNKKVTFSATATSPSGAVASRVWTVDGVLAGTGKTLGWKFATPGSHTVTLTVTNAGGYATTGSLTVTIS